MMKLLAIALVLILPAYVNAVGCTVGTATGFYPRCGDCPGNDIWSLYVSSTTLANCRQRCANDNRCKAFMFYDGYRCYPKTQSCDNPSTANLRNVFYTPVPAGYSGPITSNGKTYLGVTTKRSWSEQKAACKNLGGGWNLAEVPTVSDFNNLKSNVISQLSIDGGDQMIWIAGNDKICEGTWFYSRTLTVINKSNLKLRDNNELGNRAHEDGGQENCMEMSKEWDGLNDRPCGKPYVALCQLF